MTGHDSDTDLRSRDHAQVGKNSVDDQTFCYSCGQPTQSWVGSFRCGHSQLPITRNADEVGSVFEWKALTKKTGVIVEGGEQPTVLYTNGKSKTITLEKLRQGQVVLDMSSVPSPAYRLQHLSTRDERWARALRTWLEEQGGVESLLVTDSDHRLYVRSVIADGNDPPSTSPLSPSELVWLTMHVRSAEGAHQAAAAHALELPTNGYPDKIDVLIRSAVHGGWRPDTDQLATLKETPDDFPRVDLLRAVIGLDSDVANVLDAASEMGVSDTDLGRTAWIFASDHQRAAVPRSIVASTPEEKLLISKSGVQVEMGADELAHLQSVAASVVDDLIDDGLLIPSGEATDFTLEQRGRLDPAGLKSEDLSALGHQWEIARRSYNDGKKPEDDPSSMPFSHYEALAALKARDTSRVSDLVDQTGVLAAVAESLDRGVVVPDALFDHSAWPVLGGLVEDSDVAEMPFAGEWLLHKAINELFEWRFEVAADNAREALRTAGDEATRDEALNLIAFNHYRNGRDEAAVAALEKALAGEYTASLQANAGIVAETMDPQSASTHLGRLAAEAPTNELKLAAVRRAFQVWSTSRPAWEDEEEDQVIPPDLLAAMRSLVVEETPLEDHREMMRLLAYFDSEWVADSANTSASPHVESWEHRVYVARAEHDPKIYIDTLAWALNANPDEEWLLEERDGFVAGLRNLVFADIENIGPAAYAYAAVESGLPMDPLDEVALTCGAFYGICRSLAADQNEPTDEVYEKFRRAQGLMSTLEDGQREVLEPIVKAAGNSYAMCIGVSREAMLQEAGGFLDRVGSQLVGVPIRRINWDVVRGGLAPLREMCDDSVRALIKGRGEASEDELIAALDALIDQFQTFSGYAQNPRRAFT